jgi:hypothetical protein
VIWAPTQIFETSDSEGRDLEREIAPSLLRHRRCTPQPELCEVAVRLRSPKQSVRGDLSLGQHIGDSHQTLRVVINLRGCFLLHKLHQPSSVNLDTALSEKRGVVHSAS